jgi:hypothetical protein
VKLVFPVEEVPQVASESMWTEVLPDRAYQPKNIPAWKSGLSFDDVVAGRERGAEVDRGHRGVEVNGGSRWSLSHCRDRARQGRSRSAGPM